MLSRTILLIEDNPDDEELTIMALEKVGVPHELRVLNDGQEVLDFLSKMNTEQAEELNNFPRVIFLDLNLPKISGFEVLRALRSKPLLKNIPVVVLTSSKEESDIATSYKLGANSYIRKPIAYNQFINVVQQLMAYWLELNEVSTVK